MSNDVDSAHIELENKIGAIDMGSKNFKLVIGWKVNDQIITQLLKKENVNLGREVDENNKRIRKKKLVEIENILSSFKNDCLKKGITKILAIATSAVRNARNKEDLVSLARDYGISLDVADGQREGEVGYLAATSGASNRLVIDMGSQSFQLTWKINKKIKSKSFKAGYKIAYKKFIKGIPTFTEAQALYIKFLERNLIIFPKKTNQLISLASKTITSFVTGKKKGEVSGINLSKKELNEKIRSLRNLTSKQFKLLKSNTRKASKIFPGIILLDYVMEQSKHDNALIVDAELPVGLIVEYFQKVAF